MQKLWFLQRSMPSCTFPRNLHRNAKHYVRLPRFILKTKHQSSFILPKILLKIDSECDTMSKTTKNLCGSSKKAPKRFQDALKTTPSRLQAASKSFASPHGASSRLQAASKTAQDASKTAQHASRQPPRHLQDGPRRRQSAFTTA